jgi:hypothetical protein
MTDETISLLAGPSSFETASSYGQGTIALPHNTGNYSKRSPIASTPWKRRRSARITTSSHRRRLSTEGCEVLESRFITTASQSLGIHCALAAGTSDSSDYD